MNIQNREIERRFLVNEMPANVVSTLEIQQTYLDCTLSVWTNRVDETPQLTLKNISDECKSLIMSIEISDRRIFKSLSSLLKQSVALTIRVRIIDSKAVLTIKGPAKKGQIGKPEIEFAIDSEIGEDLITKFHTGEVVRKTRHIIPYDFDPALKWEVDVFHDNNDGLVTVEIEIPTEDFNVSIPTWVGKEITHDYRYANSNLAQHPFNTWE